MTFLSSEKLRAGRGYNLVIVIASRPQQAVSVHAGGDDCQRPCGAFYFLLCLHFQANKMVTRMTAIAIILVTILFAR